MELAKMTDEKLQAEADRLAEERTKIRLQQNAVTTEQETRKLLASLSGSSREVIRVRLTGSVDSAGEAEGDA